MLSSQFPPKAPAMQVDVAAVIAGLTKALERIAMPLDCGCVPCTGQCRSAYALENELEERRNIACAALIASGEMGG